jgi:hypothetical protein
MNITGFSRFQKYRYVGDINGFATATKLVLIESHNNHMLWVIPGNCGLKKNKKSATEWSLEVIHQTEVHLVLVTPWVINCDR